jgi:hypothetical protein
MKRFVILAVLLSWTVGAQDVPPPGKPKDDGPSLEVTARFIQDQLNGQGKISTMHTFRNTLTDKEVGPQKLSWELSAAALNASSCQMSWRELRQRPATASTMELRFSLNLHDISRLGVLPLSEDSNRGSAKRGQPEEVSEMNPEVYLVKMYMSSGISVNVSIHLTQGEKEPTDQDIGWTEVPIYFREEQLAQRIAKALVHAVELCGGGSQDPF